MEDDGQIKVKELIANLRNDQIGIQPFWYFVINKLQGASLWFQQFEFHNIFQDDLSRT